MKVVPAILTDSFLTAQSQLDAVKLSPLIEAVSIDIIDGQFTDTFTITPLDLTVADFKPLAIDFHFMTEEPMDYLYECIGVKEYLPIRRVFGQVERMSHQQDFLEEAIQHGWEAGLALDLYTPLDTIDNDIWPRLQHVLLLGVEAGNQGQPLNSFVFEKMQMLRSNSQTQNIHISVDGGVKLTNATDILSAGADELMVGSGIWESPDPAMALESFYRLASSKRTR